MSFVGKVNPAASSFDLAPAVGLLGVYEVNELSSEYSGVGRRNCCLESEWGSWNAFVGGSRGWEVLRKVHHLASFSLARPESGGPSLLYIPQIPELWPPTGPILRRIHIIEGRERLQIAFGIRLFFEVAVAVGLELGGELRSRLVPRNWGDIRHTADRNPRGQSYNRTRGLLRA